MHVRNLSMLGVSGATDSKSRVELYEKGYGKDAAGIAKEAIAYGKRFFVLLLQYEELDVKVAISVQQEIMTLMLFSSILLDECKTMRCVLWVILTPSIC